MFEAWIIEAWIIDAVRTPRGIGKVGRGALAHMHPATGAILIGTLLDELERIGGRYGLATMCAAGGMAPAIIIERIDG